MALNVGGAVLITAIIPTNNVNTPPIGGTLDNGSGSFLLFGAGGGGSGVLNRGGSITGNPAYLREVRPGTSGLFGKIVQCVGKGTAFRGTVLAAIQLELATSGGSGTLTECVLVQSNDGFRFLATAASVEEV